MNINIRRFQFEILVWIIILAGSGLVQSQTLSLSRISRLDYSIESIRFQGNTAYSNRALLNRMKLHSHLGKGFFGWEQFYDWTFYKIRPPKFKVQTLRLDISTLTNLYKGNGFYDIDIQEDVQINPKNKSVIIILNIKEGLQALVHEISFSGNQIIANEDLAQVLKIKLKKPFNPFLIEPDKNNIQRLYLQKGKPLVDIQPQYEVYTQTITPRPGVTQSVRRARITFFIRENATYRFGKVYAEGINDVSPITVFREYTVKEGEIFNSVKVAETQQRIYGTGLFNTVNVSFLKVDTTLKKIDLKYEVSERKMHWLGLRIGARQEPELQQAWKLNLIGEWGHRNINGKGRTIGIQIIPAFGVDRLSLNRFFPANNWLSNPKNEFNVTLIEPWLWKIKLPTSFRLSYKKGTDLTRSLDFKIYGFDASFTREFIKNVRGYVTLGFSKELDKNLGGKDPIFFNPDSNNVLHQVEINSVIINLTNEYDTRNDLFFPTRGFFLQGRIKYSGNPINGLNNYLTFTAAWSRFQEMAVEDMIFANRVQLNFLVPLDETPLAKLPLTAPLYLGGSNTIRGYSEGELGQMNNVPFGKFSILGNFEIRYPLFWIFRGTVFFDIGNVYPEFVKLKFNILKTTTGVGLTVNTPLGPIRFDYAWRVREGELFSTKSNLKLFTPGQFHLGLLYAF